MRNTLVETLGLQAHPEGGFFRETFRAKDNVLREGKLNELRSASTAIYYLLCDGAHSTWHKIRSDEVWHFYAGDPINIHAIDPSGRLRTHRLGNALVDSNANFQAVVTADQWFAAELCDPTSFALVGCSVAPGFEYSEFELANYTTLVEAFPQHKEVIRRLGPS